MAGSQPDDKAADLQCAPKPRTYLSTAVLLVEPPSEDVVADEEGSPSSSPSPIHNVVTTLPPEEQVPPPYSIYSTWEKRWIVLGASLGAFISPLTGQIYLPALNKIETDFHITASKVNLTVTTYMIFQGITPMFVGGLADGAGRRPAYAICFVVYIGANIGLALCRNYASLLVVRCVQSAGSSSTVALCQAVVADIVSSAERGQYIGITIIPIVFAPSLGPVLGGLLSQYLGWRSIFWFLTIVGAVLFVGLMLFLPETCRKIVGDGSVRPHPIHRTLFQLMQEQRHKRARKRQQMAVHPGGTDAASTASTPPPPLKIQVPNLLLSVKLATQKEIGLLLLYSSLLFAGFYAIGTSLPSTLKEYGLDEVEIGLCYLPLAVGSIVAAFVVGPAINRGYQKEAAKLGRKVDRSHQADLSDFPIERARLKVGIPLYVLSCAVMLCWGWAVQKRAHLAVLCVLLFLNGIGMTGFNNAANALLVDVTPGRAGAAVAANNLTRCLVGAAATAVITPMISHMGAGWAFFLIGIIYVAAMPGLFLIQNRGMKWRQQLLKEEERKTAQNYEKS
ncbi:major facilitator superfamily transporter multidrug resistance [Grosmannia clavigera kw1407]|uniref:Major facilitator superfamily transporter multidrug resistance n=1 Tax=Grosmannia clavigera (strain kw1407 / UAMH 11150) TaxID=655863 RepID=F0XL17_GROCL|nr:major facilitator superfamily transporter multidrug resistance [Grosmannia clavigera kw1407]EFX01825.1 major facilitator superfamily transporter multidrug resistance [Grosmannia clavigera kw1407]